MKNEVPASLLQCEAEPKKPNLETGSNAQDYKNLIIYLAQTKRAGASCRNKLESVKRLVSARQGSGKIK